MILSKLFSKRASVSVTNPRDPLLAAWFGGGRGTAAGVTVTPDTAMRLSAVYGCVKILSESIASLSLPIYKRVSETDREVVRAHPLYRIHNEQANRINTALEYREFMAANAALRGNAYAIIETSAGQPIRGLMPISADKMRPFLTPSKEIAYEYFDDELGSRILLADEVHHWRGLSSDGINGMSPIEIAKESVGLGIAAEEFGARFFANGTTIGGVLEHPGKLSDDAYERLKKSWAERHSGAMRSNKPAILEQGMKWTPLGIPPDQAQFLETRKFQIQDIARIFRIPPHMLGDLERATFSNIEHQSIEFVRDTLRPWLIRIEQAMVRDLFTSEGRRLYYPEHNVNSLLRGDQKSRYESYSIGIQSGFMTRAQARAFENWNEIEGLEKPLVPLNMTDAPEGLSVDDGDNGENDSEAGQERSRFDEMLRSNAERVARKEVMAAKRAIKDGKDFSAFCDEFYSKHSEFVSEVMAVSKESANDYASRTKFELLDAIKNPDRADEWENSRVNKLLELH